MHSSLRTKDELSQIYERHFDTVYRVCFLYMKNKHDAEDLAAETFLKLMKHPTVFDSHEHEKAWLIRVATNLCKNRFRHWWSKTQGLEAAAHLPAQPVEVDETLQKVLALPPKYKTALYLHYYEGYSAVEIASMLKLKQNTVYSHLHTGRKLLKSALEMESE